MNLCSDNIGGTRIRIMARPAENGFLRNYYLVVSHVGAPQVTAFRNIGQNEEQALRRFEVSRDNAAALLARALEGWAES